MSPVSDIRLILPDAYMLCVYTDRFGVKNFRVIELTSFALSAYVSRFIALLYNWLYGWIKAM